MNTDDKQLAMERAGATREESYKAMVRGLTSTTTIIDKFGEEHIFPDTTNQLRAAELITKAHGDWKEGATINNNNVRIEMGEVRTTLLEGVMEMGRDLAQQIKQLNGSGRQTGEIIDI